MVWILDSIFQTKYGTNFGFKLGIWYFANNTHGLRRLKVIDVTALRCHGEYGATASVNHWRGAVSDKLSMMMMT